MRTERVAFAVCGSFCTHAKALDALSRLAEAYETVIPIASENAAFTDTRFGAADALLEQMEAITGREVLYDIPSVEPLGPQYHREAGQRHRGHGSHHGGQIASAERPAGGAGGFHQ